MENKNNVVDNGVQDTNAEPKTFTQEEVNEMLKGYKSQEEVNEIIKERLSREVKKIEAEKQRAMELELKAELEEAEKLAKMSEAERVKAKAEKERVKFEKERKKFEEEMRAFNQERMLNITMTTLNEKSLPVEFAPFLRADNAEQIMENISAFDKGFNDAVEKAVVERLKGRTPMTSTINKNSFSMEQLKGMSAEEINKNWANIKNNLK